MVPLQSVPLEGTKMKSALKGATEYHTGTDIGSEVLHVLSVICDENEAGIMSRQALDARQTRDERSGSLS